jgi:16S rRNA (uracil1498-N3)-methyltransferase
MRVRLYIPVPFKEGVTVSLSEEQTHYLMHVLRLKVGDALSVFNGHQGEWQGILDFAQEEILLMKKKKKTETLPVLVLKEQSAPHLLPADVWLCCAVLKKAPFEFLIQKATELGVGVLQPILTEYTQPHPFKKDRFDHIIIEAAEQCRLTALPEIKEPIRLKDLLNQWPQERNILFCDERTALTAQNPLQVLSRYDRGKPWAIMIGPEGGFSMKEQELLRSHPQSISINLGPRIMRADTAALSALTLWQACLGDWH